MIDLDVSCCSKGRRAHLIAALQTGIVVVVAGITVGITGSGIAVVLPAVFPHDTAWYFFHLMVAIGFFLNVVINFAAAVLKPAGMIYAETVPKSCW